MPPGKVGYTTTEGRKDILKLAIAMRQSSARTLREE